MKKALLTTLCTMVVVCLCLIFGAQACTCGLFSALCASGYKTKKYSTNTFTSNNKKLGKTGNKTYSFIYNNTSFIFSPNVSRLKPIQKSVASAGNNKKVYYINKILNMGFDLPTAINYVFPGFEEFYNNISGKIDVLPVDAKPYAFANNCRIGFKNKQNGQIIDKTALYNAFFENIQKNNNSAIKIKTSVVEAQKDINDIRQNYSLASTFATSFASSGVARKTNIKTATNAINSTIIKDGQTISFNELTGERSEKNGYMQAKIIVGGVYTDGFGGGVCQVSTTLYNACLLAGLDIAEVHNHSLPSSYVSPCFDAMVNSGTSDLKISNNTGSDVIIAAACINDSCKVCIYGKKPRYKIVRRYEKYQTLPSSGDEIVTDISKYPGFELQNGEARISYSADGYRAKGYLDYYDGETLVKTVKIRDNTYSPKKGIVLKVNAAAN